MSTPPHLAYRQNNSYTQCGFIGPKEFLILRTAILVFFLLVLPVLGQPTTYPDGDQRAVVLKGTRNTRELGGLPAGGGTVKKGRLFRSGALCFASRDDAAKLHALGIQTILELRLDQEIGKDGPDKSYLVEKIPNRLHWPMGNSHGLGKQAYQSYMTDNRKLFRDFFRLMSKPESYPVLYHCSAGKDRTGILTALLLESLGTPREVITDDYIHSRRITPKLKVEEDWLQVVYDEIDAGGGIESYLKKIGVTPKELKDVRNLLIQKS
ncbi:MAG TPA: tyrosine-protein phosphatase [Phycisphaerales bacterium]|nr:tyrosine-protein phosphatase [Phycisphaerales bacterium]